MAGRAAPASHLGRHVGGFFSIVRGVGEATLLTCQAAQPRHRCNRKRVELSCQPQLLPSFADVILSSQRYAVPFVCRSVRWIERNRAAKVGRCCRALTLVKRDES
jgi:hypothetical protein